MQTGLFILSVFLMSSMEGPTISVEPGSVANDLILRGPVAAAVFEHLSGTEVQASSDTEFEVRKGQGILCVRNHVAELYLCRETVSGRGEVNANFPAQPEMRESSNWVRLNFNGPSLATLFTSMGDYGDVRELPKSTLYLKKGKGITCTKTVTLATQTQTFSCSQFLSSDGFPIGTGTDPLIGSGTHPVMNANEGDGV